MDIIALALPLVKVRLNRLAGDTTLDGYLESRLRAVQQEMERTGIVLNAESPDDLMLLVDWTVWEYGNRDKAAGVPDWLRLRRRERWLNRGGAQNDS